MWSFFVAFLALALDQLSKTWIRSHLAEGESLFQVGFFRIDFVHNTGAAFGLFPDHSQVLTVVSILGTLIFCGIAIYASRFEILRRRLTLCALGLVLAGTMGNLIDRLAIGYVTDFIDFTYWPAFNVADSSITIGVLLFAFAFLTQPKSADSP